jgi:hypothetical protein
MQEDIQGFQAIFSFPFFFFNFFFVGSPQGAVCAVPKGLMDYITPYDVCESMPALRELVTAKPSVDDTVSEVRRFNGYQFNGITLLYF